MTKEDELTPERFFEVLKGTLEYLENKKVEQLIGSKQNPYCFYCNNKIYKKFKEELPLDENDMYCNYGTWVKVINVDKHFEVEVKPYEPKFNNTNYKPFYHDIFKKDNSNYAVKILGKRRKNKI